MRRTRITTLHPYVYVITVVEQTDFVSIIIGYSDLQKTCFVKIPSNKRRGSQNNLPQKCLIIHVRVRKHT